jgi:hypothetical protein
MERTRDHSNGRSVPEKLVRLQKAGPLGGDGLETASPWIGFRPSRLVKKWSKVDSLLALENSLFFENNSLLCPHNSLFRCAGNFSLSH